MKYYVKKKKTNEKLVLWSTFLLNIKKMLSLNETERISWLLDILQCLLVYHSLFFFEQRTVLGKSWLRTERFEPSHIPQVQTNTFTTKGLWLAECIVLQIHNHIMRAAHHLPNTLCVGIRLMVQWFTVFVCCAYIYNHL